MSRVLLELQAPVATLTLDDPERRNALSSEMFTALESALAALGQHETSSVVRLCGSGPSFCAGFDLAACVDDAALLARFIHRLSGVTRSLRRLRQVVVAEAHGAALAGGCALLAACDFVCVSADAKLGYPVHRIGVSPAVSLPTLLPSMGGAARALVMSGDLLDGPAALARGLATHCAADRAALADLVQRLSLSLGSKGPAALAATKRWLNELDGTDRDDAFDRAADASAALCGGAENVRMLKEFWAARRS